MIHSAMDDFLWPQKSRATREYRVNEEIGMASIFPGNAEMELS